MCFLNFILHNVPVSLRIQKYHRHFRVEIQDFKIILFFLMLQLNLIKCMFLLQRNSLKHDIPYFSFSRREIDFVLFYVILFLLKVSPVRIQADYLDLCHKS